MLTLLKLQESILPFFLLPSLLKVVLLIKTLHFFTKKYFSIIKLTQLCPKTHIIDCFCYILANAVRENGCG
jgi:hypothetical protein